MLNKGREEVEQFSTAVSSLLFEENLVPEKCSLDFRKRKKTLDHRKAIRSKGRGMLIDGVILLYDNIHTSRKPQELLTKFKKLTLEEALLLFDKLNSDLDLEDIYIEPPDVVVVSDEDSAEEDEGGLTDNIYGRQLRVNAEISRKKTRRKDYSDLDS
ncbi:hypothetical protein AVEN_166147-1 [Araneus ventricosus]|uniref:Uncharacterized protein n=1 Tax=Araneus ventricosus TaxID=182803 RepID=A0A4Y2RW14_ARAVE|nr:hypothetical protein AVEN_166147-1 [Araneus ventricosus]